MLRTLKQAVLGLVFCNAYFLVAVGRAFANDSEWADKMDDPWWKHWIPAVKEHWPWIPVLLLFVVILFFARVYYVNRNEPDRFDRD